MSVIEPILNHCNFLICIVGHQSFLGNALAQQAVSLSLFSHSQLANVLEKLVRALELRINDRVRSKFFSVVTVQRFHPSGYWGEFA